MRFANQIYIGYTRDLRKRVEQHNDPESSSSTKKYAPWRLQYYEAFPNQSLARERESSLKNNGNGMRELKKRIGLFETGKSGKGQTQRGYTLLEMIVAVGLFSIIMLLATGAYFNLIKIDREARAVNDVVSNLSFAVDSLGREIRTGTGYKCNNEESDPNCTDSAGTSFGYTDSVGREVSYWLSSSNQIIATIDGDDSPLTDPRIHIDTLSFYVRGVNEGTVDNVQPQTLVAIEGSITTSPEKTVTFSIQTSATQRLLEL